MPFRAKYAWLVFLTYVGAQFGIGLVVGMGVAIWYAATRDASAKAAVPMEVMRSAAVLGAALGMTVGGAIATWLMWLLGREAGDSMRTLGWAPATRRAVAFGTLAGVVLAALFVFGITAIFPVPNGVRPGTLGSAITDGGWRLYTWALLGVAIAPPVEELVFRGALWTGLERSWGAVAAAIAVTLVFVALHIPEAMGYLPALITIALLGVLAIAARRATGSLVPGIAMHTGYNAVIVVAVLGMYA